MENEKITFRPINSGLGLNHYNDVLPKGKSSVNRSAAMAASAGIAGGHTQGASYAQRASSASIKARDIIKPALPLESIVYASPLVRSLAFVVDLTLALVLFALIVGVSFQLNGMGVPAHFFKPEANMESFLSLAYLSVFVGAFFLVQEMFWGKTIGLALFGIQIRASSRVGLFLRFIFFPLSLAPFGLGLLWAFFDEKNRAWHDVIAGVELTVAQVEGADS